jgi:glycopeptide antibiotics resistance protein
MSRTARPLHLGIATVYGAALIALVLLPFKPDAFWNFLHYRLGIDWSLRRELALDAVVNVLLFLPAGAFGHRLLCGLGAPRPWLGAVVLGAALGAAIELTQWLAGWRDAEVLDAVCNGLGGALGAGFDRLLARPGAVAPPPAAADDS